MQVEVIVHVIDDDPSFLKAVSRLLRAGGYTVKTFTSAAAFFDHFTEDVAGCILLDLKMPGQTGLEVQAKLAETDNCLPIIFLTGHGDIPSTVDAIRHGAEDFLTKPVQKNKLFDAVNRALTRGVEERAARVRLAKLRALFDDLSLREIEVLTHVITGKLNKQIAFDLGISERTIKAHRGSLMKKLGMGSVPELVRFCEELSIKPAT